MNPSAIKATDLSRLFWEGVAQKRFLLQYDPRSDRYQFYPRPLSLFDIEAELEWREAAGTGTLIAHTICHKAAPGFEDEVPYRLALVELDEGPRVFARLLAAPDAPVGIGDPMRIAWNTNKAGDTLYAFEPAL